MSESQKQLARGSFHKWRWPVSFPLFLGWGWLFTSSWSSFVLISTESGLFVDYLCISHPLSLFCTIYTASGLANSDCWFPNQGICVWNRPDVSSGDERSLHHKTINALHLNFRHYYFKSKDLVLTGSVAKQWIKKIYIFSLILNIVFNQQMDFFPVSFYIFFSFILLLRQTWRRYWKPQLVGLLVRLV